MNSAGLKGLNHYCLERSNLSETIRRDGGRCVRLSRLVGRNGHEVEAARVRRAWDRAADRWEEFVETGLDYARLEVHGPALLKACGRVRGLRVLDVGCGQGYFSRLLAERGASVVGIDVSPRMIAHAKMHEEKQPLGIEYRVMDARKIGNVWTPGSFDLITACMSLDDMPRPDRVIQSASRILADEGGIAFSVVHSLSPHNSWRTDKTGVIMVRLDDYFEKGSEVVRWDMPRLKHHWSTIGFRFTISDWSRMADESGFSVERIYEPRPSLSQVGKHPELRICYRLPFFLVFRLGKRQETR